MDAKKFIEELEKEIETDEASIAVKKRLVAEWKKKYGIGDSALRSYKGTRPELFDSVTIDVNALSVTQKKKSSFPDEVIEVTKKFGKQEYGVLHVESVLKAKYGLPADDVSLRSKISTALSKLKDAGVIELASKGGGNVPNTYKNIDDINDII